MTQVEHNGTELETGIFSMPRGMMIRSLFTSFGLTLTLSMFVMLFCCAVLGVFIDIRFFIVALMILFLVFPMYAAMLYFNYGLREECFLNVMPHKLRIDKDGIIIEAYAEKKNEEGELTGYEYRYAKKIDYADIHGYIVESSGVRIPVGAKRKVGFIYIPQHAFGDADHLAEALKVIYHNKNSNKR